MSTPEIDPVTAESMEEDADFADEHTAPTFRDQDPAGAEDPGTEDRGGDSGGMEPA
jgi:hypothetical protein